MSSLGEGNFDTDPCTKKRKVAPWPGQKSIKFAAVRPKSLHLLTILAVDFYSAT